MLLWIGTSIIGAIQHSQRGGPHTFDREEMILGLVFTAVVVFIPTVIVAAFVAKGTKATWWVRGLLVGVALTGVYYVILLLFGAGDEKGAGLILLFYGAQAFTIGASFRVAEHKAERTGSADAVNCAADLRVLS